MLYENLSENIRNAIVFSPGPTPDDPRANYPGFHPQTTLIPEGFQKAPGYRKAPCDILFEQDAPVVLRDGTTIYVDIYRPAEQSQLPVIINSTIFGKSKGYVTLENMPDMAQVKPEWISGIQSFEAADPFYWCGYGYAVVTVDMRGIGNSEGNACYFGSQDASDNYDIIEHFGKADWSNGKVTLAGNSWLGITQWYVAALNPPHLACIAPWEGHGNMYDDEYMRGGIPQWNAARVNLSFGKNLMEDLGANMAKFPLMNEYWDDKYAKFEQITCPAYVTASYTSPLHTHGTFEGFRRISSEDKWLRVHNMQEWSDFYNPKYADDLRKFFDYYMKGTENGWKDTPHVRISVLDPGHPKAEETVDRPEADFPLPQQVIKKFYLDASDHSLKEDPVSQEATITYEGDAKNVVYFKHDHRSTLVDRTGLVPDEVPRASFTLQFDEDTEITGYIKVKVWMEAIGHDDMDVYVRACKLDADGNPLFHDAVLCKFTGPGNMLRASHREIDPARSTPCEPFHPHRTLSYLSPGEIVPLEIGLWPIGERFHKGEKLQIVIAGHDYLGCWGDYRETVSSNKGQHVVYTGGRYDSHVLIPFITRPSEK